MSRHQPLQSQVDELDRIFGGCEVVQDPNPFEDAADIIKRYEDGGYDEIVVVAPFVSDCKAYRGRFKAPVGRNGDHR